MLDQNDLQAIRAIMQEEIGESEKRINDKIDTKIAESENLLLEEMDRVQMFLESKINTVKENLEELKQYCKITKLENDTTAILLKMIEELARRVEELEKKSA